MIRSTVVLPSSARRSTQVRNQKMGTLLLGGAEHLPDVAFHDHRCEAASRVASVPVACRRFSIQRTLSFFRSEYVWNKSSRAGSACAETSRASSTSPQRGPEEDPQWSRHARMHENAADRMQARHALFALARPERLSTQQADRLGICSPIAELGRIVKNQDRRAILGNAAAGGQKMPRQNRRFAHATVREKRYAAFNDAQSCDAQVSWRPLAWRTATKAVVAASRGEHPRTGTPSSRPLPIPAACFSDDSRRSVV